MMQKTAQERARSKRGALPVGAFAHPVRAVAALPLQQGMHVADLGAGSGAYALAIAGRLGNTGRVYAIDVQRDLLRRIKNEASARGFRNVDVLWSDLESPRASRLREGSVDLVLISNLLFQVAEKLLVLAEAARIVKSIGHVVIIDWNDSYGGLGPMPEDVFEREAALKTAAKAKLELVREFTPGAHHYGLILKSTV